MSSLYNNILNSIGTAVTHALCEKAGVIEFDNKKYRDEICNISKILKNSISLNYNTTLQLCGQIFEFEKFSFHINSLSWLKELNIYYRKDSFFDAGALTDNFAKEHNLFILDQHNNIELGSIYIIDNEQENITYVLFHEMCHLYDNSRFSKIWMEDELYFLDNNNKYDINHYKFNDNVNSYDIEDIHNVLSESMKFANFTESHAYMENINFEMFERINRGYLVDYLYVDKEMVFAKSSRILFDIYNLEKIVFNLRNIDINIKKLYIDTYKDDINLAYYNFNTFDKIVNYIYKKLHKIISHSRTLFNYYYNLDSSAKKIYELDENTKNFIAKREHYTGSKRNIV